MVVAVPTDRVRTTAAAVVGMRRRFGAGLREIGQRELIR
jgi:hypothetical protein